MMPAKKSYVVIIAVIYTKLPLGWVFEGGFEAQDSHKGGLTKVDGGNILEIDGRPAVDVYDEWLGGKIKQLQQAGADDSTIRNFLILNPFYRRFTSRDGQDYFLFSHPWPVDAPFAWGEQGYFPGVGYKHGNLLTSFLVIGEKEPR